MDDFADLLQLPMTAVRERIEQELEENPVLELRFPAATEIAPDNESVDIVVDGSDAGAYDVRLSDQLLSDLLIDPRCMKLGRDPALRLSARENLGKKLDRARRFLEAVERRREILQRVAEAIFRRQSAFLEHGPGHIAPLYVDQVVGEAGIDALTVLRALQGVQVRTRHGVLALDCFLCRQTRPSNN